MIFIPIEERYSKNRGMFHSGAFAIASAVVATGATATSGIMGAVAADRAAKSQAAATRKYQKKIASATEQFNSQQAQLRSRIEEIDPTIQIPQFNLQNATVEGIQAANRATANTLKQIEKIAPGSAQASQQVGQIIGSYLRGEVPQDVQQQTLRNLAEFGGAGFNLQTAGRGMNVPSLAQANFARSIGQTSLGLQQFGMEANWRNIAQAFNIMAKPENYMAFGLEGRAQDIGIAQSNIRNQMLQAEMIGGINTGQFNALTGQAQLGYQSSLAQAETDLTARQASASAVKAIGSAISGGLQGASSAFGQRDMARLYDARTQAMNGKSIYPNA